MDTFRTRALLRGATGALTLAALPGRVALADPLPPARATPEEVAAAPPADAAPLEVEVRPDRPGADAASRLSVGRRELGARWREVQFAADTRLAFEPATVRGMTYTPGWPRTVIARATFYWR